MTIPQPSDWTNAYARTQRVADREILALLRTSVTDINKMLKSLDLQHGIGAGVRAQQLRLVKMELLRQQAKIFTSMGDIIGARRLEAAARAVQLNGRINDVLFGAANSAEIAQSMLDAELAGLSRTMEVAVARMTQSAIPLSQRIYRTQVWMNDRLQKKINSALARGLSAREFAAEARDWFDPNTPGGVRYAAMRLARSEINNAFHAMSVASADAPWVEGMRWQLSRSHPKADDCDSLAHEDRFRMGAGVFPTLQVPRKPHPQCFCFITPVVVEEDEFLDQFFAGTYDKHIDSVLSGSHEPSARMFSPPAPKVAAPPSARTLAQREHASAVRTANAWGHSILSMPAGDARTGIARALATQARLTPKSLLKLKRVQGDFEATKYGQDYYQLLGRNTGAAMHIAGPSRGLMIVSPAAFEDAAAFARYWEGLASRGWLVPKPGVNGLESTIAHEYGHHLDSVIREGRYAFTELQTRALFPQLSKEFGIKDMPLRDAYGQVGEKEFDAWIARNQSIIGAKLSRYGSSNGREMIGEIWAEYSTMGTKARPFVRRLGRILQKMAEGMP